MWTHDRTPRAALLASQAATSVQSGAASSPRQALLQVRRTTTTDVGWVAVHAALARLKLVNAIIDGYLIYCRLKRPVVIVYS